MIKQIALSLVFLGVIHSCQPRTSDSDHYRYPEFSSEYSSSFELLGEPLFLVNVHHLNLYGNHMLLFSNNLPNGLRMQVYDKKDGSFVRDGLHSGRGPGEVLHIASSSIINGILYVFDDLSNSVSSYGIDKLLDGLPSSYLGTETRPTGGARDIRFMEDGDWLVLRNASPLVTEEDDFIRLERIGRCNDRFNGYPLEDRAMTWNMYQQPEVTISPDNKKYAIASTEGCILETFSLTNGIVPLATRYMIKPDFIAGRSSINSFGPDYQHGISSMDSTNDLILASSTDGKTPEKTIESKGLPRYPYIAVFDWRGKPKYRIKTDYSVIRIAYDAREKNLYAALLDDEGIYHLGRMDMSRFK